MKNSIGAIVCVGVLVCPLAVMSQGVIVRAGQVDSAPLPTRPVAAGLPISMYPAPQTQPLSPLATAQAEASASMLTLQAQLRYTLGLLNSSGTVSAAPVANASTSGANLGTQASTNLSERTSGNLSVNLSSSPASGIGSPVVSVGSAPVMVVPAAQQQFAQPGAVAPTHPVANNGTISYQMIYDQMQQLLFTMDTMLPPQASAANGPIAGIPTQGQTGTPVLTPTGRTPDATAQPRRPQPPGGLRIVP